MGPHISLPIVNLILSTAWGLACPYSLTTSHSQYTPRLCVEYTRAQIKDSEDVTNRMHRCNIDVKVTLSESLICARVIDAEVMIDGGGLKQLNETA